MMGGGAGHMQDMVNKIKQNAALRASRRKDRKKKFSDLSSSHEIQELSFKKVSSQELEKINKRNRLLIQKENLRTNILTGFIGIPIVIVAVYYIIRILTLKMS